MLPGQNPHAEIQELLAYLLEHREDVSRERFLQICSRTVREMSPACSTPDGVKSDVPLRALEPKTPLSIKKDILSGHGGNCLRL